MSVWGAVKDAQYVHSTGPSANYQNQVISTKHMNIQLCCNVPTILGLSTGLVAVQ